MSISHYLTRIIDHHKSGHATEHTYRGDLAELIRAITSDIKITNEPSNVTDCGNPDFVIFREKIPVGFIEAKDVGKDLGSKQYKEQFSRYKRALDNLIITDYLNFQFFHKGEFVNEVSIAKLENGEISPSPENHEKFSNLIVDFCSFISQTIKSPKLLAEMMAGKARLLENIIESAITSDEKNQDNSSLQDQYRTFRNLLIHDLTPKGFADIYAQTLAYGMFAARLHDKTLDTFSRQEAAELIPKSNPFLRKLFGHLAGADIDQRIITTVDNLADLFRATNIDELLKNFGKTTQTQDPIIHFYETFLSEYDPKIRRSRGVWYTPEPIVKFIVKSVDQILKDSFSIKNGIADTEKTSIKVKTDKPDKRTKSGYVEIEKEVHRVQILDPATGTGTFLAEAITFIYEKCFSSMQGAWTDYVDEHLIPRLNGFELLMASYSMAHLKLDLLLSETGYQSKTNPRFNVFLTNSLEEHHPDTGTLFASWLSTEANEANNVKRDSPVMVVLGNPPYSSSSSNKGHWIQGLLDDYKKGLNEKKVNIDDDYIKFIRYAHHLITRTGEGIVAFISNNSFLDGITTRQMRKSLLNDFDDIYILDLHGDVKKRASVKDENVFDIQQGVSINIFVKHPSKKQEKTKFKYFDLYGKRIDKYNFLLQNNLKSIEWQEPDLHHEYLFFNAASNEDISEYSSGLPVNKVFKLYNSGIQTKNDSLLVQKNRNDINSIVNDLRSLEEEEFKIKYSISKEGAWKVSNAMNDVKENKVHTIPIQYRPFDYRYTAITDKSSGLCGRPRFSLTKHFINSENIGLVCNRQSVGDKFSHIGVSESATAHGTFYLGNRGQDYLFPLYTFNSPEGENIFSNEREREHNLTSEAIDTISSRLNITLSEKEEGPSFFSPLDVFFYTLAVLNTPAYQEKFNDFLKMDFPRVPIPFDKDVFFNMATLGKELSQVQLLKPQCFGKPGISFPVSGSNLITNKSLHRSWTVSNPKMDLGKIWINETQFFDGIPLNVWDMPIGGYLPAQKWLKDRLGTKLSFEDILHYQRIIEALVKTSEIKQRLNEIFLGQSH